MISIASVNQMPLSEFLNAFGDVAEHSPWVAEAAARERPFDNRDRMIETFERAVRAAPRDSQLALIRAHPDLARKASLTADSAREQKGAGLDTLTSEEMARFTTLNDGYRACFGFPFIFAVKGATKHQILASFEERIGKQPQDEFETALSQVCRIFRFRIEDRVSA